MVSALTWRRFSVAIEHGQLVPNPPLVETIAEDPMLADTKIIAEAWDAAGAYQVGSFVGTHLRWAEWNGRYRDDVRRFWRGDGGHTRRFGHAPGGIQRPVSAHAGGLPYCSINFITSHDGFTLNDLVSYRDKHNEANGEGNRDGDNNNLSDNYGVEGPTRRTRSRNCAPRQIKNMMATLLLSQGVPMMVLGDECRRTQQGNNNAYCQDNDISWFDWRLVRQELRARAVRADSDPFSPLAGHRAAEAIPDRTHQWPERIARRLLVRIPGPAYRLGKHTSGTYVPLQRTRRGRRTERTGARPAPHAQFHSRPVRV